MLLQILFQEMNILPKKKWHVRTKENVARVRRDQKKAAEEEKRVKERAQLAEQEFKVNLLRKNASQRMETMYGVRDEKADGAKDDIEPASHSGHVNFFADLELEGRKNLGTTNRENEMEKKKEQEEYEKKIGILTYLGQGSIELTKEKPWYEKVPVRSMKLNSQSSAAEQIFQKTVKNVNSTKKQKHREKHNYKGSNREKYQMKRKQCERISIATTSSGGESFDSEETAKKRMLEKLRQERLDREAKERKRLADLLKPVEQNVRIVPKFNSQFNPHLARQNLNH